MTYYMVGVNLFQTIRFSCNQSNSNTIANFWSYRTMKKILFIALLLSTGISGQESKIDSLENEYDMKKIIHSKEQGIVILRRKK